MALFFQRDTVAGSSEEPLFIQLAIPLSRNGTEPLFRQVYRGIRQAILAEFIHDGMYERHLRRLRKKNTIRRAALLDGISHILAIAWKYPAMKSGLLT